MAELGSDIEKRESGCIPIYKGPVWYYWRQAGMEEGLHAAHFISKPREVFLSQMFASAIDNRFSQGVPHVVQFLRPLTQMTRGELVYLVDHLDPFYESFVNEERNRAVEILLNFVDGALVSIENSGLSKREVSSIRLGVGKSSTRYSFFYEPYERLLVINIGKLKADSGLDPFSQVTVWSFEKIDILQMYLRQSHEKQALRLLLDDARIMSINTQVSTLEGLIKLILSDKTGKVNKS